MGQHAAGLTQRFRRSRPTGTKTIEKIIDKCEPNGFKCEDGPCVKCVDRFEDPADPTKHIVTLDTSDCKLDSSAISWVCCTGACTGTDPTTCTPNAQQPQVDASACEIVGGCTPESVDRCGLEKSTPSWPPPGRLWLRPTPAACLLLFSLKNEAEPFCLPCCLPCALPNALTRAA